MFMHFPPTHFESELNVTACGSHSTHLNSFKKLHRSDPGYRTIAIAMPTDHDHMAMPIRTISIYSHVYMNHIATAMPTDPPTKTQAL